MSTRDGATLADWLTPAHIGWSVRHARELVPTEAVRASIPRDSFPNDSTTRCSTS